MQIEVDSLTPSPSPAHLIKPKILSEEHIEDNYDLMGDINKEFHNLVDDPDQNPFNSLNPLSNRKTVGFQGDGKSVGSTKSAARRRETLKKL